MCTFINQSNILSQIAHTDIETYKVVKIWDDAGDQDGERKNVNAKVQLYKTVGDARAKVGDPVEVGTADGWSNVWENLPVMENGKQITYSVEETMGENSKYTKEGDDVVKQAVAGDSGTIAITNSYTPQDTEIEVTKVWEDSSNQDGKRPTAAEFKEKVHLHAMIVGEDGTETEDTALSAQYAGGLNVKVDPDNPNQYIISVEGLPMFKPGSIGSKIHWTVSEDEIAAYTAKDGKTTASDGESITNIHETEKIKISATKTWKDNNDQDGKRVNVKAKVQLYKTVDGVKTAIGDPVDVATQDGTIKTWENMPV